MRWNRLAAALAVGVVLGGAVPTFAAPPDGVVNLGGSRMRKPRPPASSAGAAALPGPAQPAAVDPSTASPLEGEASTPAAEIAVPASEVAAGYRRVLALAAGGSHQAAVEALVALETAAFGAGGKETADELTKQEVAIARDLARADADALLPVVRLHHESFLLHGARRQGFLAVHSRDMVEELAGVYAKRGPRDGASRLAATVLASLGGHLQASGSRATAARLFEEALKLEGRDPAALLGLGTLAEKLGDDEVAERWFGELVTAAPDDAQAKLRLAVVRARLGKTDQARRGLREVVEMPAEPWVTQLGWEQLAALAGAQGDWKGAVEILRGGVESFPDSALLRLRLGHALERSGRMAESLRLAHELTAEPGVEESPRARYNRWPQEWLEAGRTELAAAADRAGPRLATLLGTGVGGDAAP